MKMLEEYKRIKSMILNGRERAKKKEEEKGRNLLKLKRGRFSQFSATIKKGWLWICWDMKSVFTVHFFFNSFRFYEAIKKLFMSWRWKKISSGSFRCNDLDHFYPNVLQTFRNGEENLTLLGLLSELIRSFTNWLQECLKGLCQN